MDPQVRPLLDRIANITARSIATVRPELADVNPMVRRSDRADFQSDIALSLARRSDTPPAKLAAELSLTISHSTDYIAAAEASGPGFINITIADQAIWNQVSARLANSRLGIDEPYQGQRIIVDYSAPNIAKEMHVGHLRSTIIGDSLARLFTFLGGEVIRQNHLGDWGTQFGMLIQYLDEHPEVTWHQDQLKSGVSAVSALQALYQAARARFDQDSDFANRSRSRVVALQSGDPNTIARWNEIVEESEKAFQQVYDRLGVLLTIADSRGESFYNSMLADIVSELIDAGIAVPSEGAIVVFSQELTGKDNKAVPLILRKSDGGYGYDTTDLATIKYRLTQLHADKVLYVTDSRQELHFKLIFETARRAGWLKRDIAVHVPFGTMLGKDGRPFKTRSGDTVRLVDLLDSAVDRAKAVVREKNPQLSESELHHIAEQTGIGAVKYADLSIARIKDYIFDLDRMVSFNGNTGVYLQYSHARICAILRKAEGFSREIDTTAELHPAERALALQLDEYHQVLTDMAQTLEPHKLSGFLYELARLFTGFYEACPVLNAAEEVRANRLALVELTGQTLREGLNLLGIAAPERM